MRREILTSITLFTVSLLLVGPVDAIIANVRPAKMYFNIALNPSGPTYVEGDIYIKNKDSITEHIKLTKSITFLNKMKLSEEEFDLQPGEEKAVHFKVTLYNMGTYSGYITIKFSTIGTFTLSTSIDCDITIYAKGYSTSTTTTSPTTSITTTIPGCKKLDEVCVQNSDCCSDRCELTTICTIRSIHGICLAYRTGYACVPGGSTTTTTTTITTTTALTSTTIVITTTTPSCLTKNKVCIQNSDCCSNNCVESKVCNVMTIHGICLAYKTSKICVDGAITTISTTTSTTIVTTTTPVTTTTTPNCLTSGQCCSVNEECCSGKCQYGKVCIQYDLHGVCQRYSYKYICA